MTDYYPSEEGRIVDGLSIGFAYCNAAVEFMEVVHTHTTSTAGKYVIAAAAADGDGFAVALKAGAQYDTIPVCFFGVCKLNGGDTIEEDDVLRNDELGTYVLPIDTTAGTYIELYRANCYTGTILRLGMALQAAATSGDEILVLVGRVP